MATRRNLNGIKVKKMFLVLLVVFIGIATNSTKAQQNIRENFLVDKIYDYHNNLLVDYIYNDNDKLAKSIYTNFLDHPVQTVDTRTENSFEYVNERVSKIISDTQQHYFYPGTGLEYTYDYHSVSTFEYDSSGKLIKINGEELNFRYENGRIIGHLTDDTIYTDTIVYDDFGNVIKHIYILPELDMFGQPISGTTRRVEHLYEYDNSPKPNFGLDHLFIYQLIPGMGTETGYARELSQNNLTKYINSGTTWTYTYSEYGLPATIEMKWNGIETEYPMLLRITYKRIGETSIPEVTQDIANINIYPNPTKDKIFINCESLSAITIHDILGKEVLYQNVSGKSEINISHLSNGIYIVSVLSDGKIIGNCKIVKQ